MAVLHVALLGGVRVTLDAREGEIRLARQARLLLAYLVLHPQRRFTRDALATLFWGEQDERHAHSCLNTALWRLRRALEPCPTAREHYLLSSPEGEIGFNHASEHTVDVDVFRRQAGSILAKPIGDRTPPDALTLEDAVRRYTGELLDGFYEPWVIDERRRVHRLYTDSLEWLMRFHSARGASAASLEYAERLLHEDPLQEQVHRTIMEEYLRAGQRSLALRQYRACRRVLKEELGLSPGIETEELYYRILRTSTRGAQAGMPADPDDAPAATDALRMLVEELDDTRARLRQICELVDGLRQDARAKAAMREVERPAPPAPPALPPLPALRVAPHARDGAVRAR